MTWVMSEMSMPPERIGEHGRAGMRGLGTEAVEILRGRLGPRLKVLPHERRLYGYDATRVFAMPDAVAHVCSEEEVRVLVEVALERGIPLVGRGAGTGLSGGAVPEEGGIVVSFEAMREIGPVDEALRVWVGPGVVNRVLDTHLLAFDLFYPPDPASHRASTLGGNIAENSGGPRAVKYGVTGLHVARLRLVDGFSRLGTFVSGEYAPGADLVSLVVGSEGTLALVTAAQVAAQYRPPRVGTCLLSFPTMAAATTFVSALVARGIVPPTLEFMDRATLDAVESHGIATYAEGAQGVLLIDLEGTEEEITRQAAEVQDMAAAFDALGVDLAFDPEAREALWLGRRAWLRSREPHLSATLVQDVTVPRARLTDMLLEVDRLGAEYRLHVATKGHAGDGNLHPDIAYDPRDPDMAGRAHAANMELLEFCVALGGSITGEHGIGTDKLHQLPLMYGPVELGLMAEVKRALDPTGILNPGKAILPVPRSVPSADGRPHVQPADVTELQEAVLHARKERTPLRVDLSSFQDIAVDLANMTIEVGAGTRWDDVEDALAGTALQLPVSPLREGLTYRAVLLNDYGSEHVSAGTYRQSLLAATYVTGYGEIVRMGRAVMKNVAGYDLFRPLIGSRGRLGIPISFVFRLVPRQVGDWYQSKFDPVEPFEPPLRQRPVALFAVPGASGFTGYGRFADPPVGWEPAPEAIEWYDMARQELQEDDLLDLAFPLQRLPDVMGSIVECVLLLPAAARVLLRVDRNRARELVSVLQQEPGATCRALWGRGHEALHSVDPVAGAWESALQTVFDPDAILTEWLLPGTDGP